MLHNTVGWCSVLVTHKSLYNLFWSLQSATTYNSVELKNLWNIMSNLYCSCKQILLIYPTDLFTSVIELTITQHSVWQYRIVRRSDLLQDQFNNSAWNTCMYTELCHQKTQVLELITISTCISATLRDTHCQFSENICSDDDLRSEIFGTFAVKFLACLPLLGYLNI